MVKKTLPNTVSTADVSATEVGHSNATADVNRQAFVSSALSMSWQMAVVVLVPLVGGFKIDQHFKSSPVWTLIGFGLALLGMVAIVGKSVRDINQQLQKKSGKS